MHAGKIYQDDVVAAPATSVWQIYRGFNLGRFVNQHLSDVIGTVDFVEGDGGVGSVIRITLTPGPPGIGHVVERFTILDDEKRIMEAVQVEGGYLALGFTSIRIRLEFTEKSPESTIIKSTVEYEIDEKLAQNVSFVSFKTLKVMAEAVEKHLIANKASA